MPRPKAAKSPAGAAAGSSSPSAAAVVGGAPLTLTIDKTSSAPAVPGYVSCLYVHAGQLAALGVSGLGGLVEVIVRPASASPSAVLLHAFASVDVKPAYARVSDWAQQWTQLRAGDAIAVRALRSGDVPSPAARVHVRVQWTLASSTDALRDDELAAGGWNDYVADLLRGMHVRVGDVLRIPVLVSRVAECAIVSAVSAASGEPVADGARVLAITPSTAVLVAGGSGDAGRAAGGAREPEVGAAAPPFCGYSKQRQLLLDILRYAFRASSGAATLSAARGVLLFGPPGTGKTLLVQSVGASLGCHTEVVNGADVARASVGEAEQQLAVMFARAARQAPAIVFLDEVDALIPRRSDVQSSAASRLVASFLSQMDALHAQGAAVVVVGATNRPDALDEGARRPGRFDLELELGVPTLQEREAMLRAFTADRELFSLSEADVLDTASRARGCVGADLRLLVQEAVLRAMRECSASPVVRREHLLGAAASVRPSALREFAVEIPRVLWRDIGGYEAAKQKLREMILWPLERPELFARLGIQPPRGVLLYGPPGCSKTLLAKALATESGMNFIAVKGPELFSKWVGESEKAVQNVFRRARLASPCIVFFDEVDAVAGARGASESGVTTRVVATLLAEIDGVRALRGVTVLAATNRPSSIDPALLRPGRLDESVYIALPDRAARLAIAAVALERVPHDRDAISAEWLAEQTDGYSGAELVGVVRQSAALCLQEDLSAQAVQQAHVERALAQCRPQTSRDMVAECERFSERASAFS